MSPTSYLLLYPAIWIANIQQFLSSNQTLFIFFEIILQLTQKQYSIKNIHVI